MKIYFHACIFLLCCMPQWIKPVSASKPHLRSNLNIKSQDFILETKRIQVPEHPYIFNPSIVRWNNAFLMSFRVHDNLVHTAKPIGLVWLDKNFNVISKSYTLKIRNAKEHTTFVHKKSKIEDQDPRLITIDNHVYMVYSNFRVGRMFIAELQFDGTDFFLDNPECLLNFDDSKPNLIEKNWVPFEYNKKLLLSYSIAPHKVFLPLQGTESCKTVSCSPKEIPWKWGTLRGGSPALKVDGKYLAFFHCVKHIRANNKVMPYYFMGAYLFEPTPPFTITHISPEPIVGPDFYTGEKHKTWKPLRVVFPAGFVVDKNSIWVAYGKQDHESWLVKIDKKKLFKSLKPV